MSVANREQEEHWNSGEEGDHWVTHQVRYDAMLEPFVEIIMEAARLEPGAQVLDVGCGCGATTRAAARGIAPGSALGWDLSRQMLERARQLADAEGTANVAFEVADAQVHPVEPAAFDVVISRFGVMFFSDPVAAFANLRRAVGEGGRIAFVCWQPLAENEWLIVPGAAIAEHVALPPAALPGAPGMFALSDAGRVKDLLQGGGWREVAVEPRRVKILLGGEGDLDDAVEFLRSGSIGRTVLSGADADTERRALSSVRAALAPFGGPGGVRLEAAAWVVTARS